MDALPNSLLHNNVSPDTTCALFKVRYERFCALNLSKGLKKQNHARWGLTSMTSRKKGQFVNPSHLSPIQKNEQ